MPVLPVFCASAACNISSSCSFSCLYCSTRPLSRSITRCNRISRADPPCAAPWASARASSNSISTTLRLDALLTGGFVDDVVVGFEAAVEVVLVCWGCDGIGSALAGVSLGVAAVYGTPVCTSIAWLDVPPAAAAVGMDDATPCGATTLPCPLPCPSTLPPLPLRLCGAGACALGFAGLLESGGGSATVGALGVGDDDKGGAGDAVRTTSAGELERLGALLDLALDACV